MQRLRKLYMLSLLQHLIIRVSLSKDVSISNDGYDGYDRWIEKVFLYVHEKTSRVNDSEVYLPFACWVQLDDGCDENYGSWNRRPSDCSNKSSGMNRKRVQLFPKWKQLPTCGGTMFNPSAPHRSWRGEQRAPEPENLMCSIFLRDKMFV